MSDIEAKRTWVGKLYPGKKWRNSVSKMPDGQVLAIYMREKSKPPKAKPKPKRDSDDMPF